MNEKEEEFFKTLRAAFVVEAGEHLDAIVAGLLELEKSQSPERQADIVAAIFREAHSLKGAARAVNLVEIETFCQSLESVFAAWRRSRISPSPELFDPLHFVINAVREDLPVSGNARSTMGKDEMAALLAQLSRLQDAGGADLGEQSSPAPPPRFPTQSPLAPPSAPEQAHERHEPPDHARDQHATPAQTATATATAAPIKALTSETLRISTAKLDRLLLLAEELLSVKLAAPQRAAELAGLYDQLWTWEKDWGKVSDEVRAVRDVLENGALLRASDRSGGGAQLLDFLDSFPEQIKSLRDRMAALSMAVGHDRRSTAALIDTLLEESKKLLLLPFSTLLSLFPKLVRDLSREQGKEVDLVLRGGEIEIDKRILEEMKDALIHLLRNSVDHGIEQPQARTRANKPARGTITVSAAQVEGNKVEILVSDDGNGINTAETTAAAVRKGILSAEEARTLSEKEAIDLVFQPELSTSPILTEISGRGLGLAIVIEKVEKLGGRVVIETHPGQGTSFRMLLPLTLTTFRGIVLEAGGQTFVVPTMSVERVIRIKSEEIHTAENRETLRLNDQAISLVRLDDLLQLPRKPEKIAAAFMLVLILVSGEKRIAFRVDEVLDEQEVLVKPLVSPWVRVRNVAAATVLGSGKPVAILNVSDLIKSASGSSMRGVEAASAKSPEAPARSILVVEDSITARMLLKNVLESGGYHVKTAVDGLEALTALKTEDFDLVVSDVEMPRMNGFGLTTEIRANAKLKDLPVILVTALASREDRERGVDAGANAYIVKSNFDQSNLLDAVQRLL